MAIKSRRWILCLLAFSFSILSQYCQAHNNGVVVQSNSDKLVTGFIDETSLIHAIDQRAFPVLMPGSLADDFPGFLSQGSPVGGNDPLPDEGQLHWDFLPMHLNGIASNLFYWDGVGATINDVDFVLPPTQDVSLSLYKEDLSDFSSVTGTDEVVAGKEVGTVDTANSTTPLHAHLWSFLGSSTTVPEGIYLFSIRLTMEDYENSDALYVVAATPTISESTLDTLAMPWVENNLDTLVLPGDFDFDGDVDGPDFLAWQREQNLGSLDDWQTNFGTTTVLASTTVTVPEPTSLVLSLFALCLASIRPIQSF